MIVVAGNYRLDAFGFLSLDELAEEDPNGGTGNFGTLDQRMAMQWVQDNIAKFGGDPNRVMIAGESAGGFSVCWHLASPGSAGLFHAATIESGSCDSPFFFQAKEKATSFGKLFSKAIGCDPAKHSGADLLKCLRALPENKVMLGLESWLGPNYPEKSSLIDIFGHKHTIHGFVSPLAPVMPFGPTVDGTQHTMPLVPLELIKQGKFNKVPVIMGTNRDEGNVFAIMFPIIEKGTLLPLGQRGLHKLIGHFFGGNDTVTDTILAKYPKSEYGSYTHVGTQILTDCFFRCGTRRFAREMHKHGIQTYLYQFSYEMHWIDTKLLGNYHTSELDFVFDNSWPPIVHSFNSDDKKMASYFGAYWSNMARYGSPNAPGGANGVDGLINWPLFDDGDLSMELRVPLTTTEHLSMDVCDFWDSMPNPSGVWVPK
eukprot:GFYU01006332.1.p1 GENE.GFYU01006332.1~~GFYU01006332.1.p1  ORF type:complete len:472 (+),score=152.04 GFYU01006332.1:138-1418(+)